MGDLEIRGLSYKKNKNSPIVKNISLKVNEKDLVCLVGPVGSGKTTMLSLIAGLLKPDSGKIFLNKYDITNMSIKDRKIGFVPQNPSLIPHLNVVDNITFTMRQRESFGTKQVLQLLENMRMKKYAYEFPQKLSIGEQQNIAIIRAIISSPRIMLFDEPYANFDSNKKDEYIEQSIKLIRKVPSHKILVTHHPREALLYADYIYVVNNGEIEQSGTADQLYYQPKNLFVAKLFGEVNIYKAIIKPKVVETIFGKFPNILNSTYRNASILIRPHNISLQTIKVASSIPAKILTKKFQPEGFHYSVKLNQYDHIVKIISKTEVNIEDKVYLKLNKYHLIGY